MRPTPIFSATLCGVLWVSAGSIVGAAAQGGGGGGGGAGVTSTTSAAAATSAASIPAPGPDPTVRFDCLAVYPDAEGGCQDYCKFVGVASATVGGPCTRATEPAVSTTDASGNVVAVTVIKTVTDTDMAVATVTLAGGMPLYTIVTTEMLGLSPNVRTSTRTHTMLGSETGGVDSPSATTANSEEPDPTGSASSSGTLASGAPAVAKSSGGNKGKNNAGAIAGGVVGGILGIVLIAAAIFFIRRHKKKSGPRDAFSSLEKNRGETSPQSTTPQIPITSYDPPPPPATQQPSQQPHPESQRSLMGPYSPPGAVVATKQPDVEVDEDGVSLRSPSPPLGEDTGRGRDYVPRLPIYHRGSDETPRGPAL